MLLLLVVSFGSCKKEDKPSPEPQPTNSFTQKVLIEKFTTTSCGNCGKADLDIEWYKNHYQQKLISVHYHLPTGQFGGDKMATQHGTQIASAFDVRATPYAAINRSHIPNDSNTIVYPGGNWGTPIDNQIKMFAQCGIAIDASKISGDEMQVEATVSFSKTQNEPMYITVLLLEDSVTGDTGYWQANYYNQDPNVPELYGRGHPIKNYVHNDVYRQAISPFWGQLIPSEFTAINTTHTVNLTTNIAAYNQRHLKVVAFVHGQGTVFTKHKHKILNAQIVRAGQKQPLD